MWLVKHLKETKNQLAVYANCKTPRIMEGKNLLEMTEEELHCSEYYRLPARVKKSERAGIKLNIKQFLNSFTLSYVI